nr:MAG TPA: Major capsid protein [Microviridae sp.]
MAITKALGGERLGSGNKMNVKLHGFNRSSHNIGQLFKTDQAIGTLVPYFCDIGLNGTTYKMDLTTKIRTLPTTGPIFGRLKHQIDVFHAPIRLYIRVLHNNALGIGMKMQNVKLPIMTIRANQPDMTKDDLNSQQISQDSLLAYLGIRGLGRSKTEKTSFVRTFPAIFLLMYWDIYKNYYANKQEEIGYVIGRYQGNWKGVNLQNDAGATLATASSSNNQWVIKAGNDAEISTDYVIYITYKEPISIKDAQKTAIVTNSGIIQLDTQKWALEGKNPIGEKFLEIKYTYTDGTQLSVTSKKQAIEEQNNGISLQQFELSNIDNMREAILAAPKTVPFNITTSGIALPYSPCITGATVNETNNQGSGCWFNQSGLGIKTYLSDRFNNWLSTEWIDGEGGIADISSVDVSDGMLKMDALILAKKIYDMMNRIAVSDGSYQSWQEVIYDEKALRIAESPMYVGGMSSEIVFDEIVSNSAAEIEGEISPLGTLAGRGAERMSKGGNSIKIKVREPSMIMVIGSFTPRIDYSQGNKWWTRLQTMNDFHKPNLDGIGFQELITDEMAAFDTEVNDDGTLIYKSAGKQVSWQEYMTNVDQSFGSFSAYRELAHMAMNRNYEHDDTGAISDLTTYIDPTKFNVAFADAKLSAKNIWVQCAIDCIVRRKMSAKQIPNL